MSDLDGRCFARQGNALVPADVAADEYLAGIPQKREVIVQIRRPRSPEHHRWFFALLRLVLDATNARDTWPNEEAFLQGLKISVGHVDTVVSMDGEITLVPKSINFASMDQDAFARFVRRCAWVIEEHFKVDPVAMMDVVDKEQRVKLAPPIPRASKADVEDAQVIE